MGALINNMASTFGTGDMVQCRSCNGTGVYQKRQWGYNANIRQRHNAYGTRDHGQGGKTQCDFCKRFGHQYSNCRRRLKQCIRCGSGDHFVANCSQQRGPGGSGRGRPSVECFVCGETGHLARDCPKKFNKGNTGRAGTSKDAGN